MALLNQWLITMGWGGKCTLNLSTVLIRCCHVICGLLQAMSMMRLDKLSAKQSSLHNHVTVEIIIILAFPEQFRDNKILMD
jgi:F0F1-type ATP synthase membrane subunit c/vacuolar-type H+-ATPase subunit K